jgi:hypothetical protein
MEQQGDQIFLVSYIYNQSGNAVWYAATLTRSDGVKKAGFEFNGQLTRFSGGQTLIGNYVPPLSPEDIGSVRIVFETDHRAVIDWPGGKQSLERFYFRKQQIAEK